jgi:hypothetical protein
MNVNSSTKQPRATISLHDPFERIPQIRSQMHPMPGKLCHQTENLAPFFGVFDREGSGRKPPKKN